MPFLCGEAWTGASRSYHSPSFYSIDWNRPDDYGHPLLAAAPGVVTRVVPDGATGYGRYAIIDHGAGSSTLYAHMKETWLVEGMTIDQSQPGRVRGRHRQRHGSASALRGAAQRHRRPVVLPPHHVQDEHHAASTAARTRRSPGTGTATARAISVCSAARPRVVFREFDSPTSTLTFGADWDRVSSVTGTATEGRPRRPAARRTKFVLRRRAGAMVSSAYGSNLAISPATGMATARPGGPLAPGQGPLRHAQGRWPRSTRPSAARRLSARRRLERRRQGRHRGVPPSTTTFLRGVAARHRLTRTVALGADGDLPAVGDWNSDRITDLGVWSRTGHVHRALAPRARPSRPRRPSRTAPRGSRLRTTRRSPEQVRRPGRVRATATRS